METKKQELLRFGTWMRNGTSFCTTWFLILVLIYGYIHKIPHILTDSLFKMLLLTIGGVFLFSLCFTKLFIRKWSFIKRLSCFMVSLCIYQCIGFYWLGIFTSAGNILMWGTMLGIVLVLYFCCIIIYHRYCQKKGALYTESLLAYQQKRRLENEE